MKTALISILSLLLLSTLWIGSASAEEQFIRRAAVTGRSGPGTFFDAVVVLKRGRSVTVTETVKRWAKVKVGKHLVWIPTNGLVTTPKKKKHRALTREEAGDISASPAGLAAAAKGFASQFAKRTKAHQISTLMGPRMSAEAFQKGLKRFHATHPERSWPFPNEYQEPPFADGWESKLGLAVTAKLVGYYGLVEDHAQARSLTLLANVIGLQSVRFDIPWKVFVLDSDELNAFGLSDGYILITRGLLAKCTSLEERAAILAHEVAHVVRYHNLTELQARKVDVQADTAQDAMNKAFGEAPDPDVEALSSVAMQAYSFLHKDRLEAYEYEADHLAAVYLYRAGLPPHALVNVLNKVKRERGDQEAYSGHPAFSKRIKALNDHIRKMR
ncbi:MAG: M48 family metalloprotease [Myxococcota bacterium]